MYYYINTNVFIDIYRWTIDLNRKIYPMKKYKPSVAAKPVNDVKQETIETHEPKSPFWDSVVSFAKPKEESLSELITALDPQKQTKQTKGSRFTENFKLVGHLNMDEPLMLEGSLFGNVESSSELELSSTGRIHGDIKVESLISAGSITGDVNAVDRVETLPNSILFGDISAQSIVISGKVEGHLTAHSSITLKSDAQVKGNLSAQSIEVEEGAKLEGRCEIQANVKTTDASDFIVSFQ